MEFFSAIKDQITQIYTLTHAPLKQEWLNFIFILAIVTQGVRVFSILNGLKV